MIGFQWKYVTYMYVYWNSPKQVPIRDNRNSRLETSVFLTFFNFGLLQKHIHRIWIKSSCLLFRCSFLFLKWSVIYTGNKHLCSSFLVCKIYAKICNFFHFFTFSRLLLSYTFCYPNLIIFGNLSDIVIGFNYYLLFLHI